MCKRAALIMDMKAKPIYADYSMLRPFFQLPEEPVTPDSTDRRIPKRAWEFSVAQWRGSLRRLEALETDAFVCQPRPFVSGSS